MPFPAADEDLLPSVIDRMPDPVLVADDARRYIYANQAACGLFGLSSTQLLGRRIDEFLEAELALTVDLGWHEFLKSGVQSGPFRLVRPDGGIREVEYTALAGIHPGAHISFLRDVTQQRNAERKRFESQGLAELAMHAGRMGSWMLHSGTGGFTWNRTLEEIYGFSNPEMVTGYQVFLERIHPEDRATVRQVIGDAVRSASEYQLEYRIIRADGELRWVADRGRVMHGAGGQHLGLAGVCWDITHTKVMEQEQIDQGRELARSNADLQRFAYVASHDLKEPLRNVCAFSQLLERQIATKLDSEELEMLHLITGGAKRMTELIDSLLAYSQVTSKRDILLEEASADHLLTQALDNLRVAVDQSRAHIERQPLPNVRCAPVEIVQIFQNLIGNGLKYSSEVPPHIKISAEGQGSEWVFKIADNGIGINPRYHDVIFGVFKRLHGQEYSGTGIGLAICKAIVEKHRGRMWVESEEHKGSAFYFSLPQ